MDGPGTDERVSMEEEEDPQGQESENEYSPSKDVEKEGTEEEEEETQENAQVDQQKCFGEDGTEIPCPESVDSDEVQRKELEERRKNVQQWMEKLAKIKQDEFKREEAAMIPLRHYLMAHVVPTLTKGLIEVTRARPNDPVEFLAEFLFQNNPGNISSSGAQTFKVEML